MSIPTHLLRALTLQQRTDATDAYNASVPSSWTSTAITGRIDQRLRREELDEGRQAEVSEWLLITNATTVAAQDRVVDGTLTYEVVGRPWPVYGSSGVHHHEATLRLVVG